jgi:hypothetical protein
LLFGLFDAVVVVLVVPGLVAEDILVAGPQGTAALADLVLVVVLVEVVLVAAGLPVDFN